ncbi:MAG: hypothetical protein O2954_02625 [bacterium]|nr:hypothetical protein [bacterium]
MEQEKNILDHLGVIVRWRRLIFISFFSVTLLAVGITLILPKAYRGRTVVYPPKEAQDGLGLSALLGNLPMGMLGLGESGVSATDFVPVIQSEHVAEAIIKRFNLRNTHGDQTREELLDLVSQRLDVELSREQFLTVSYEAETPELAAQMTNAFVEELDRALRHRREKQAGGLRTYLEKRLAEAEAGMFQAEKAYNEFQNKYMAIDVETQARAQIESASTLIAENLGKLIIQREIAALQMESGHPKLNQLDLEIQGVREALDRILMGPTNAQPSGPNESLPDIFIPFRKMPDLGLKTLQLKREVEIRNAIYQFVLQEYEKSSFEEKKETAMVVVLDPALPPDSRSKPRRTLIVAVAGGLSLALSTMLAFIFESFRSLEGEDRRKLDHILGELKS